MNEIDDLKIVIFDCDGVLFNSLRANTEFYNEIARLAGRHPLDAEELSYCHMHTAEQSIRFMFKDMPHLLENAFEAYRQLDYGDFLQFMEKEPGMVETVETLRTKYRTAISTNRSTTMPRLREIYRLDDLFDKIVCALDVENPKPHPEGVQMILDYFNLEPENAVYIGDSSVDEEVSSRAGVPFVAYKNPSLNAMFHVEHFEELNELLLRD